uniref:Translation initiation factor IF-2 n=1 Tax=Lygus hesperus TaxID=30085 RepID=A0A0A9WHZ2_LYGHE
MVVHRGTLSASHPSFRVRRKRPSCVARSLLKSKRQPSLLLHTIDGRSGVKSHEEDGGHVTKDEMDTSRNKSDKADNEEGDDYEVVYEGAVKELRRYKDLVPSVDVGLECGVILYDEFAFQTGDVLEQYEILKEPRDVDEAYAEAAQREQSMRDLAEHQAALEQSKGTTG